MKTFFDSSTLLTALLQAQPGHSAAAAAFENATHRLASSHSSAECFAQLSGKLHMAPADASTLLRDGLPDVDWVTLPAPIALGVVHDASRLGIRGGLVYDAMIVAAARHARADLILTGNPTDFLQCAPDLADRIRTP